MDLHCILVQRTCSYPGEFAPELWEAVDEYTMSDNGDYYQKKLGEALDLIKTGELISYREIVVSIPDKDIALLFKSHTFHAGLNPASPPNGIVFRGSVVETDTSRKGE